MPKAIVGGKVKHFAYTPSGIAAAKRDKTAGKEDKEMAKAHKSAMKRVKGY